MKSVINLSLVLLLAVGTTAAAQTVQVTEPVNVLPPYKSTPSTYPPGEFDFVLGDLYLQRQGEPAIAISTANKDHIAVFFNDFRAVDAAPPLDSIPEGRTGSVVARVWDSMRGMMARLTGRPVPKRSPEPEIRSAAEAGIGMAVSYNAGRDWTGGFMPGMPFDTSNASLVSPARGMEAQADARVAMGACGKFYTSFLAFTRGKESRLLVSRWQFLNWPVQGHFLKYLGTTQLAVANNSTNGLFLDMPQITTAPTGVADCNQTTEQVFVTGTRFTGSGSATKFQSILYLWSSSDGGRSFQETKVDSNYTQSQGTSVIWDDSRKNLLVFFRSFNSPHTIVMRRKTAKGWEKAVDLLAAETPKTLQAYDQPTVTTAELNKDELTFRTNGYPSAAITPDGSLMLVAFQERVDESGNPSPTGKPGIVWKYSTNGGTTWSTRRAVANNHDAAPAGLGFFDAGALSVGPQVMPTASCSAGTPNRCVITYYEARPYPGTANGLSPLYGWIGGYDRALDVRGVIIDAPIGTTGVAVNRSFPVSRYSYGPLAKGQVPTDSPSELARHCVPGGACYPALNYSGYPHTGGGTSPFMHDYGDTKPLVSWVKAAATGQWQLAKTADDVPYGASWLTAWADNSNVLRPSPGDGTEWATGFRDYSAPGRGGLSCDNPGSRDQNVSLAQLSVGLMVTAPTNYKPFQSPYIEFPMTVWNNTSEDKKFKLELVGNAAASFSKDTFTPALGEGYVKVYPRGSSSLNVYVGNGDQVTVKVTEYLDSPPPGFNPLRGSISFNAPAAVPPDGSEAPIYQAANVVVNPVPKNPVPKNPVPKNPVPKNPVPKNTTIEETIDYSWTVEPSTEGDPGTYLALPGVDRAYQDDYIFQVFVTNTSSTYSPLTEEGTFGCEPRPAGGGALVSHISEATNPVPKNPVPKNPVPKNPVPKNATIEEELVQNSTFTFTNTTTAASSGGSGTLAAMTAAVPIPCSTTTGETIIGAECIDATGNLIPALLAAPRQSRPVIVTVRAYRIKKICGEEGTQAGDVIDEGDPNDPNDDTILTADLVPPVCIDPARVYNPYGDPVNGEPAPATPPSVTVAEYWCSSSAEGCGFAQDGPDLEVASATADVAPTTVRAGQQVTFSAVDVTNEGTQLAKDHRFGFYITDVSSAADLPRNGDGTIATTTTGTTRLLSPQLSQAALPAGGAYSTASTLLTIPFDMPRDPATGAGTYYICGYADDRRVVSEIDEDNNITCGGPITVLAPEYDSTITLLSPCSSQTVEGVPVDCVRGGSGAVPLAWQFTEGGTVVDSETTSPRLTFFYAVNGWEKGPQLGQAVSPGSDLSTGSSGFQYCNWAGTYALCSAREPGTWQFNWERRTSSGSTVYGPFLMYVEVPATGQTFANGKALGPVRIFLQ